MVGLTQDVKYLNGFEWSSLISRMINDIVVQRGSFLLSCVESLELNREMQKSGLTQDVKSLIGFESTEISRIDNDNVQGGSFLLI